MDNSAVIKFFNDVVTTSVDRNTAVATVKTLMRFLEMDDSSTLQEFSMNIRRVIECLKVQEPSAEVSSVSEMFVRYATLKASQFENLEEAKKDLISRGTYFRDNVSNCKFKVARSGQQFISDGSVIMTHSKSRVVLYTLEEAKKANKRIMVYVTQSCPNRSGEEMIKWLKEKDIKCKLILDAAIGFYMEKVDMVLVGAEAVVQNGGIINKVGTYPMALTAKAINKPFYVLVESYKFSRIHPLKQEEISEHFKFKNVEANEDGEKWSAVDYTHPRYVTLLLTDLGPLDTAAVSDVLMQLYL